MILTDKIKEEISGKNILLILPKFYDYVDVITKAFKNHGAHVTFFYDRDVTLLHTFVSNFKFQWLVYTQAWHYNKILRKTSDKKFDFMIVVKGLYLQPSFVEEIKTRNPGIKTILYQWDSINFWLSDYRHLIPIFDETLSFDYEDCKTLGIPYVPTFSLQDGNINKDETHDYDFIFCANFTWEKFLFAKKIKQLFSEQGKKAFIYIYLNRFRFYLDKIKGKKLDDEIIKFKRLNNKQYQEVLGKSKMIIDYSHSIQSGLTMRAIDALATGKSLLTNNRYISLEEDFNLEQVHFFDEEQLVIPDFSNEVVQLKRGKYSLDDWIYRILFTKK
ncbi:MAG: hypothetical protein ABIP95_16020 [Pelobium sp.]